MSPGSRLCVFPLVAVLAVGCSAGATSPLQGAGNAGTGGAANGGGSGAGGSAIVLGDAGLSKTFAAHVEQNHVAVSIVTLACAGDCADVEAVATGGYAPYTFAWDDGSTSATRHVCPTSTTAYQVSVTDTGSTSGEFPRPPRTVTAPLTANVLACPTVNMDAGRPPTGSKLSKDGGADLDPTVYWVRWSSVTAGTPGSAVGTILIPVTQGYVQVIYSGEVGAQSQTTTVPTNDFAPASTYTSATVANGPPDGGMVALSGGAKLTQTITFSAPVRDPLIAVWSVGFGSLGQTSTWQFDATPTVLSSGPSTSWPFSTLTTSGNSMTGNEGNGVIQFTGTFTSVSFTVPTPEIAPGYGGFTVGIRGRE